MTSPSPAETGPVRSALQAHAPAIDGYRAVLADLTDTIAQNWQGTVGRDDPEFLHDLRVAARRSRAVLANAGRVIPDEVRRRAREGFARLSDLTGPPRDLDVYLLGWDAYTAPLGADVAADLAPMRHLLVSRQDAAYETLTTWMRSDEARGLLDDWRGWLTGPLPGGLPDRAHHPLGPQVATRIERAQTTLLDEGRAITPTSPDERLHDLRKDAKKLRYLLECFGSLLDPQPGGKLVKRLKALQENLGEHQDAAVHATDLRAVAHDLHAGVGDPAATADTLLAMGRLLVELEGVRDRTRAAFAERFAAYDTAATRRALHAALLPARS
jgi:CHAD domain-containing protein